MNDHLSRYETAMDDPRPITRCEALGFAFMTVLALIHVSACLYFGYQLGAYLA